MYKKKDSSSLGLGLGKWLRDMRSTKLLEFHAMVVLVVACHVEVGHELRASQYALIPGLCAAQSGHGVNLPR